MSLNLYASISFSRNRVVECLIIPITSCFALMRMVPLIFGSANWRSFTLCKLPIIKHSTSLSYRIFPTDITGWVHSVSSSVRDFSEACTLNLGANELELISGGSGITGLYVINLYHGFGVVTQASSFRGR